ncbi:MAG: hypothetical protein JWL76_26 [Thermoleophilia bacterium]|nr:hypothetical protein [Thermoleophilia bacterium]
MNELAEQKLAQHLYEAHATELMLVHTLTAHIAITPKGDYRDGLQSHLRETKEHARRIEEHLAARDQGRGLVQVGYGMAQGVVGQALAFGKLPIDLVRGMSGEEKLLKNARDEFANEAMEIAAYLAIEELAKAVGDTATAKLAASIRADEERMFAKLQEMIPRLASDVVRAEVNGNPRFDVRHIGAVDAAWSVASSAARTVARQANRASRSASATSRSGRRAPSPTPLSTKQERSGATRTTSRKRSTTSGATKASASRTPAKRTAATSKTKRTTTKKSRSTAR